MSYVSAILLAAGRGRRVKSDIPKPHILLRSRPIIAYSLEALNAHPGIKEIILVASRKNLSRLKTLVSKYSLKKVKRIVLGGRERRDSVSCGLKAIDRKADIILIHDGARPFLDKETISRSISGAEKFGAVVTGVPVKATIKSVKVSKCQSVMVQRTIDRSSLWEIQTPQAFKRRIILEAYAKFGKTPATDDAMLVEKSGHPVRVVAGSYNNIKITTPEDLILAEAIARKCPTASA